MVRIVGILVVLISFTLSCYSQQTSIRKATIVDSIAIKNTTESYALYLPSSYDETVPSSIVIIFEPGGRAAFGLKNFKQASEKFNFILVSSNDSKNGKYEDNYLIANRLFEEVFATFNIDENQIFLSGFSGGSRLATSIAILSNKINGVLACGAGPSNKDLLIPSLEKKFLYKGLVGNEDMNYLEMLQYEKLLTKFKVKAAIRVFNGAHIWPPEEEIIRGFDWIFLQNNFGSNEQSPLVFREQQRAIYNKELNTYISDNKLLLAESHLLEMQELFQDQNAIILKQLQELRARELYKDEKASFKKLVDLELSTRGKLHERFFNEYVINNNEYDYSWWRSEIKKIRKEIDKDVSEEKRAMGKRILYGLFAIGIENGMISSQSEHREKALYGYNIASLVYPENASIYFLKAKEYASMNKKGKVMSNLKLAVENGFTNYIAIANNEAFVAYKGDKKFMEILESIKPKE